ncbi:MAG: apolipoprotein N-acyltransferase [Myxococcota bacterium]|nr:apolipoprotein N-acyltransferase [Myxococcota bacterium]
MRASFSFPITQRRYSPATGTLLSVALAIPAFPPYEIYSLMWVALVPWLLSIVRCKTALDATIQGYWMNLLVGLGWGSWVPAAVSEYLGVSTAAGLAALFVNASFHQLHFVLFAPAFHWLARSARGDFGIPQLRIAVLLFAGLDWLLPNVFQHTVGWALHSSNAFVQLVELGGPLVLTLLILLANVALFTLVHEGMTYSRNAADWSRRSVPVIALVSGVLFTGWVFGAHRYAQVSQAIERPLQTLQVGLVQGNVRNELRRRWASGDIEAAREALRLYIGQTEELLGREDRPPDLILWPETAYPGIFRRPESEAQANLNVALDQYIAERARPFIFGAYDREDRIDRRVLRNAIFFVQPQAGQARSALSPMDVYHKHILFPVGEYLPFASESFIRKWLPRAGSFTTGSGPKVFDVFVSDDQPAVRMGPTICYEDLFPSHALALAELGAQLIVNVSNDSWFGDRGLPRFHLIVAKLRSIETRLPQVRATNTGYSGLVLPNGEVPYASDYGKTQTMNLAVPIIAPHETLIMTTGDWVGRTSLGFSLLGLFWLRSASRPRNQEGAD